MPLTDDDKEHLKLLIESSINGAMKPVMEHIADNNLQLQRHEQLLVGVDGTNGLNGDMKKTKERVTVLEGYRIRVAAIAGTVGAVASAAGSIIVKTIAGR